MNYKLISILATIIAVLAIVFASIKTQEAERQREWSEKLSLEAQLSREEAERQRDIAQNRAAAAIKAQAEANEVLDRLRECQSR